MNDSIYISKQNSLHKKALGIIRELKLVELLNKFGNVHIVGSVALKLMSWPDIDIHIESKPNVTNFLKVVNELFSKDKVYNINIQDFRKSIYPDRPQGIYCGVIYLEKPKTFWKIDNSTASPSARHWGLRVLARWQGTVVSGTVMAYDRQTHEPRPL